MALGTLRITIGENNTEEEVEYIIEAVKDTVDYLRECSPVWNALKEKER